MRYTDEIPKGFVTASCDWKDGSSLFQGLLTIAAEQGVPFDISRFVYTYSNTHVSPGDRGVSTMFSVADHVLKDSGYDIVQWDTGGDFYLFFIAPLDFTITDVRARQDACENEDDPDWYL